MMELLIKPLVHLISPALLVTLIANKPASLPAPIIECNVVFRPDIALSYRPEQKASVKIIANSDREKIQLGDFEFLALYNKNEEEGHSLQLIVTPQGDTLPIASQVYRLDRRQLPRNQFGDRGFTGLNFAMNPKSKSDLQYFCSSKR